MKKVFFCLACATMALTSCVTTTKEAKTAELYPSLYTATAADMEVAKERISYTMMPSKAIRRGGDSNVKRACIAEALEKAGGNYDLIVEPEFVIERRRGFASRKITKITVTGRPARYTNFHTLGDKVWTDPVFRNRPQTIIK